MVSVGHHPNITLMTYSEVERVSGVIGNFKVTIRKKPRYVKEELCTGCGTCIEKCPWKKIPSEFDCGIGMRTAIYYPFPQAVPRVPVIDTENCTYFASGKCKACEKFCEADAIDFQQKEQYIDIEAGTIILATGYKDFDPKRSPQYGYGRFGNVITSMELERLINSGGPTLGKVTLLDGRKPRKIAIIHCVGSRGDEVIEGKPNEYCSRVCCMYSLKLAELIREYVGSEVVEYYRDMRSFGKDYEAFYERVQGHGVEFIRYDKNIRVESQDGKLAIHSFDLFTGKPKKTLVDMVVLSTSLEPQNDQAGIGSLFGVSRSSDGFFLEKHPKLAPVETANDGIFLAGTCQGPKDIPDTVAHGGAAAAAAMSIIDAGHVNLDSFTSHVNPERCGDCRTCEGVCPYGAIAMVSEDNRMVAYVNEVLCKGCGACVSACPAGAITQNGFTNEQVLAEIEGMFLEGVR